MAIDPSLYIKEGEDDTDGLLGSYVEDSLLGGNEPFQKLTERTLERFESRPRQCDDIEFLGVHITTKSDGEGKRMFFVSQPEYASKASLVPTDILFDRFRSIRASFGWLSHSLPDLC